METDTEMEARGRHEGHKVSERIWLQAEFGSGGSVRQRQAQRQQDACRCVVEGEVRMRGVSQNVPVLACALVHSFVML